ncbi:unnamed protein product (macronuclear) [Paramecium tetraurelia]|uniref:Transmembrane protein n=1 Tax=Paramecium tetraurelia TaxID=5888 RepID=A0D847_PARTE|nr:uncharacterized protein GSPATT00014181001 [Paramecium tetraurelia]CAK79214.1 unnamed protein product [Paramecium tetraurelia]|eukprot:XP_001446611.1 hypothetical protein (macronuclear) [Paramecium tetraurelia strain d4-2]
MFLSSIIFCYSPSSQPSFTPRHLAFKQAFQQISSFPKSLIQYNAHFNASLQQPLSQHKAQKINISCPNCFLLASSICNNQAAKQQFSVPSAQLTRAIFDMNNQTLSPDSQYSKFSRDVIQNYLIDEQIPLIQQENEQVNIYFYILISILLWLTFWLFKVTKGQFLILIPYLQFSISLNKNYNYLMEKFWLLTQEAIYQLFIIIQELKIYNRMISSKK